MKKIIFSIVIMIGLASCDSFLSLTPPTQLSEKDYFKNEDEIFDALTSAYSGLYWWHTRYNGINNLCADILSDDMKAGGGDGGDIVAYQCLDDYSVNYINQPFWLWIEGYWGAYRANLVLDKVSGVKDNSANIARMTAEAHFLRTLNYYWLWLYYGNIIILDHNLANPDEYYTQKQYTSNEVYDLLVKDLDENVIGKLPSISEIPGSELGRASNEAGIMLKAKIILYQNDQAKFTEAFNQLKSVINSNKFDLYPDFGKLWTRDGEFCCESIFEINATKEDYVNVMMAPFGMRGITAGDSQFLSGWGFGTIEKELVNLYESGDIRKAGSLISVEDSVAKYASAPIEKQWIKGSDIGYEYTGYYQTKYTPRAGYSYGDTWCENNIRVFRYSDMLLVAAEMALRGGGSVSDAQTYYSKVYKRARPSAKTIPTVDLEKIYMERRLEFVGEGQRYFDILRTGKAEQILGSKGWKTRNKFLPLPNGDIQNARGSLTQNPGYDVP